METHTFVPVVIIKPVQFSLKLWRGAIFVSNGPDTCLPSPPTLQQKHDKLHETPPWHPLHCEVCRYPGQGKHASTSTQSYCAARQKPLALLPCAKPKDSNSTCCLCPLPCPNLGDNPEVRQIPAAIAQSGQQRWDAVCSQVCAGCPQIPQQLSAAAGMPKQLHGAARCSPGKLHLVPTQGCSPNRMNTHLDVSSSFSAKCFTSGCFLMILCFLSEKFKFFKIQPAHEFRASFHQVYVKKYFNTVSKKCQITLFQQILNGKPLTNIFFIALKTHPIFSVYLE